MEYSIKSVERVFEIVKAIAEKPRRPSQLASDLNMNKSTIHRFISTLLNLGYIEKLPDQSLRLSQSFINLSLNGHKHDEILEVAKPYLKMLAERFKESSLVAVFNGYESEYIDKVESSRAVRTVFDPTYRAPAYAVASGKVFLASLEEQELKAYFDHTDFISHTENTIVDRTELEKEINKVRELGFSVDHEEYEIGLRGFASPIKDHQGKVIAAICLAGIAPRITEETRIQEIISSICSAAKEISYHMSYSTRGTKQDRLPMK